MVLFSYYIHFKRCAKNIFDIKKIKFVRSYRILHIISGKLRDLKQQMNIACRFVSNECKKKETATSYKKDTLQKKAFPQKGFSSVFRCIRIEMITIIKSKLKIIRHICNVSLFKLMHSWFDNRLKYGLANVNGLVLWCMIVVITHIYGRERNTTRNIENRKLEIGLSVRQNETQIHTHGS